MLTHDQLLQAIPYALAAVDLEGFGAKEEGKVRDIYRLGDDRRLLITTDRVSAFDRVLGLIPYKGQVLNQLAAWWFQRTADIVANHVIAIPDPNVMLAREAQALPVEVIVRGYITGVTSTSLWTLYQAGVERPYGLALPPGLHKNDRLPEPVITPTTKAERGQHDERLTSAEVVERGLVEPELWEEVKRVAVALFKRGQSVAMRGGLVLVDTKYEFGLIDGKLALIDEIHTPDSSRFWVAQSYGPAKREGREPESFDKEFLRLWYVARGYRGEGEPPTLPPKTIAELAARYIAAYEKLTMENFSPGPQPAAERIVRKVAGMGGGGSG
ncbi:MAG: phosphoribosylaminoimidazolesuccinocarboxamide synthase [Caldilineales bacterium]|nr:phosphoribosylaminoimidazolesuccinocarboxamide synthase [Caldilineales bacterium]